MSSRASRATTTTRATGRTSGGCSTTSQRLLLNQIVFTIERPLAPEGKLDWGYKAQVMYGSDSRFTHTFGWLDNQNNELLQFDIVELYANAHFPVLTEGGLDLKAGQFVTLMGAEVISAPGNPLYSIRTSSISAFRSNTRERCSPGICRDRSTCASARCWHQHGHG